MKHINQVILIAGGEATRMGSKIGSLHKSLVPLEGISLLEQNLKRFRAQNFDHFHLLLGAKAEQIIEVIPRISQELNAKITYTLEESPLGTGGALLNALEYLNDFFLVAHGDIYIDFETEELVKTVLTDQVDFAQVFHASSHMEDSDLIVLDENNFILRYFLKPHPDEVLTRNTSNAGLYAFSKQVLGKVNWFGAKMDLDRQLLPLLLQLGARGKGVQNKGFLRDIGTPSRLEQILKDLRSPFKTNKIRPALFIDRDGTLNIEKGYINSPELIELYPDAVELIGYCNAIGMRVIVITNQPVISRGEASRFDLNQIHARIDQILGKKGIFIDDFFYCPHHPDKGYDGEVEELKVNCNCRKPKNGLIENALDKFPTNVDLSFMIGDRVSDIEAGKSSNLTTIFISRETSITPDNIRSDFVISDLRDAIAILKKTFAKYEVN